MATLGNPWRIVRIDPYELDTSISDSTYGSLHDPWAESLIGRVHARIAQTYGVSRALIGTNGTTGLNELALYTLISPGEPVLIERDCHVSVVQTLNAIGAEPIWLVPPFDARLGINLASTPEAVDDALATNPDIRAVVLTSPKYFGVVGDIRACVAVAHARGARVLVDEAHGACLRFHPSLPTSATEVGADLVTQSTHKTTSAWSQGSLLLINDDRLCPRLLHAIHATPAVSTSFSFPITGSVEEAVVGLEHFGERRLAQALRLAEALRAGVRRLPGLATWGLEEAGRPSFRELDPLRVTVDVSGLDLTGIEAEAVLQEVSSFRPVEDVVVAELGDTRNVLFLVTCGSTAEDIEVALVRLGELVAVGPRTARRAAVPVLPCRLPERVLNPREAFWRVMRGETRSVPVEDAIGRVSGECVAVYPPGNAMIVHGERVTEEVVAYLRGMAALGAHLKGATDPQFATVTILDEGVDNR